MFPCKEWGPKVIRSHKEKFSLNTKCSTLSSLAPSVLFPLNLFHPRMWLWWLELPWPSATMRWEFWKWKTGVQKTGQKKQSQYLSTSWSCHNMICFLRPKKKKSAPHPRSYFKVTGMWTFCFIDLNLTLVDIKKRMPMEIGLTTTQRTGQGGRCHHQVRD